MILSTQHEAHKRLHSAFKAFRLQQSIQTPVKPRVYPLIYGPTGTGKSHIVKQFAGEISQEFISFEYVRVTFSDWIVIGSRHGEPTSTKLRQLLKPKSKGFVFLHIDELDKFTPDAQGWSTSVKMDLFNFLDMSLPNLFIVGSGTWQAEHEHKSIGFNPSNSTPTINSHKSIPTELLERFASRLIHIGYPTKEELIDIAKRFYQDAGLSFDRTIFDGKKSGMRVLEESITIALERMADTPIAPKVAEPEPEMKPEPEFTQDSSDIPEPELTRAMALLFKATFPACQDFAGMLDEEAGIQLIPLASKLPCANAIPLLSVPRLRTSEFRSHLPSDGT
jgi:hypothetical protein